MHVTGHTSRSEVGIGEADSLAFGSCQSMVKCGHMPDSTRSSPLHRSALGRARQCVVLSPAGQVVRPLIDALQGRGFELTFAEDLPGVMVILATQDVGLVLIVQPEQFARLGQLIDAIGQYHPHVKCWRYDTDGRGPGKLAAVNGEFAHGGEDKPPVSAQHVVPEPAPAQRKGLSSSLAEASGSSLITQQELAMLLAGDDDEHSPLRGED